MGLSSTIKIRFMAPTRYNALGPGPLRQREGQLEPAALPRLALNANCTAMEFNQMLADRQAKAGSFASHSCGTSYLIKLFEN